MPLCCCCTACRRYVRRNIGKYLDQHIRMPPAAVLVTAVLRTEVAGSPSTDLGLHEVQPSTPSSSGVAQGDGEGSSSTQAAAEEPQPADHPLTRVLLGCFGWLAKPNTPAAQAASSSQSSSSTTTTSSPAAAKQLHESSGGSPASTSSSDSDSSPADAYAVVDAVGSSTSRGPPAAGMSSSSSSGGDESGTTSNNVAHLVGSALQRLSGSVALPQLRLQHKASQTHVVETLVGVAEVSFQERTRSQALTLNPPQVRTVTYY